MAVAEIHAADLARQITLKVRVRGMKTWRFRLWASRLLFRLGAVVAGVGVEIVDLD